MIRFWGVDQEKASQRAANSLIDGLYPGHTHGIFRGQVKAYLDKIRRFDGEWARLLKETKK